MKLEAQAKRARLKGQSTGGGGEETQNTPRAGRQCVLADLRQFGVQHASMLRSIGVRGSFGTLAFRAPSVLSEEREGRLSFYEATAGQDDDEGLPGADIKNTGDAARLHLSAVIPGRERSEANPESIRRSRCDDA